MSTPEPFDLSVIKQQTLSQHSLQKAELVKLISQSKQAQRETNNDLIGLLKQEVQPVQFPAMPESLVQAGYRGGSEAVKGVPMLAWGLAAGAGAAAETMFDNEGGLTTQFKEYAVKKYQDWENNIGQNSRPEDAFDYSYAKAKEGDLGALVSWAAHGTGYVATQLATILTGVGLAEKGTELLGKKAVTSLMGKLVKNEAKRIAERQLGTTAATTSIEAIAGSEQVLAAATSTVSRKLGQHIGMAATSFGMEGGEIGGGLATQTIGADGKSTRKLTGKEVTKGLTATAAAGAVEYMEILLGLTALKGGLSKIPGAGKFATAAEDIGGIRGRAARGGVAAGKVGPAEYAQEYVQTGLEQWSQGKDPFSPESRAEQHNAGMLGALSMGHSAVGASMHGSAQEKLDSAARKQARYERSKVLKPEVQPGYDKALKEGVESGDIDKHLDPENKNYSPRMAVNIIKETLIPKDKESRGDKELTPENRDELKQKSRDIYNGMMAQTAELSEKVHALRESIPEAERKGNQELTDLAAALDTNIKIQEGIKEVVETINRPEATAIPEELRERIIKASDDHNDEALTATIKEVYGSQAEQPVLREAIVAHARASKAYDELAINNKNTDIAGKDTALVHQDLIETDGLHKSADDYLALINSHLTTGNTEAANKELEKLKAFSAERTLKADAFEAMRKFYADKTNPSAKHVAAFNKYNQAYINQKKELHHKGKLNKADIKYLDRGYHLNNPAFDRVMAFMKAEKDVFASTAALADELLTPAQAVSSETVKAPAAPSSVGTTATTPNSLPRSPSEVADPKGKDVPKKVVVPEPEGRRNQISKILKNSQITATEKLIHIHALSGSPKAHSSFEFRKALFTQFTGQSQEIRKLFKEYDLEVAAEAEKAKVEPKAKETPVKPEIKAPESTVSPKQETVDTQVPADLDPFSEVMADEENINLSELSALDQEQDIPVVQTDEEVDEAQAEIDAHKAETPINKILTTSKFPNTAEGLTNKKKAMLPANNNINVLREFFTIGKGSQVLNATKDFGKYLTTIAEKDRLKLVQGFTTQTRKEQLAAEEVINQMQALDDKFQASIKELFKGRKEDYYMDHRWIRTDPDNSSDPFQFLAVPDESGKPHIPPAIVSMLMASAYKYMAIKGSGTLYNDPQAIAKILKLKGADKDTTVSELADSLLRNKGVSENSIIWELGSEAYKLSGLKPVVNAEKHIDGDFINRTIVSMGQMTLALLVHNQYLEENLVLTGHRQEVVKTDKSYVLRNPEKVTTAGLAALALYEDDTKNDSLSYEQWKQLEANLEKNFDGPYSVDPDGVTTASLIDNIKSETVVDEKTGEEVTKDYFYSRTSFYHIKSIEPDENTIDPDPEIKAQFMDPWSHSPQTWNRLVWGEDTDESYSWLKPEEPSDARKITEDLTAALVRDKNLTTYEQKEWVAHTPLMGLAMLIGKRDHRLMAGAKRAQDVMDSKDRQDSVKGLNLGINNSIDYMYAWYQDAVNQENNGDLSKPFYLPNFYAKNTRMHQRGHINPQGDKNHRSMFKMKGWGNNKGFKPAASNNIEEMSQEEKLFYLAVGLTLDIEVSKVEKGNETSSLNATIKKIQAKLQEPVMQEALGILQKLDEATLHPTNIASLSSEEKETILPETKTAVLVAAVKEGGVKMESLKGLHAYAQYLNAKDNNNAHFTTDLAIELDGISNGPTIARLNLLTNAANGLLTVKVLENSGIIFNKNAANDLASQIAERSNHDAYQTTGWAWSNRLLLRQQHLSFIMTAAKVENIGQPLTADKAAFLNKLPEFIDETAGVGQLQPGVPLSPEDQKILIQASLDALEEHNKINAVTTIIGKFTDKDGHVSNTVRKLTKYPTMKTIYGMADRTQKKELGMTVIGEIKDQIEAIANLSQAKPTEDIPDPQAKAASDLIILDQALTILLGESIFNANVWNGKQVNKKELLQTKISKKATHVIVEHLNANHGQALVDAFNEVYGDMRRVMKAYNQTIAVATAQYNTARELLINQALANKKGLVLSIADMKAIEKQLEPLRPKIKTPMGDDIMAGPKDKNRDYAGGRPAIMHFLPGTLIKMHNQAPVTGKLAVPTSKGTTTAILAYDAATANQIIGDIFAALNTHDGFTVTLDDTQSFGHNLNKYFLSVIESHNLGAAITTGMAKTNTEYKALLAAFNAQKTQTIKDLETSKKELEALQATVKANPKLATNKKLTLINVYKGQVKALTAAASQLTDPDSLLYEELKQMGVHKSLDKDGKEIPYGYYGKDNEGNYSWREGTESLADKIRHKNSNNILWPEVVTNIQKFAVRMAEETQAQKKNLLKYALAIQQYYNFGIGFETDRAAAIGEVKIGKDTISLANLADRGTAELTQFIEEKIRNVETGTEGRIQEFEAGLDALVEYFNRIGTPYGSSTENVSLNADDYAAINEINKGNAIDTYNLLKTDPAINNTNVKVDSVAQDAHLRGLLTRIITKVMQPVDLFLRVREGVPAAGKFAEMKGDTIKNRIFIQNQAASLRPTSGMLMQGLRMSPGEVYVHELIHSITHAGLKASKVLYAQAEKLYDIAMESLDYTAFLDGNTSPSVYEIKAAKDRYDYIFGSASATRETKKDSYTQIEKDHVVSQHIAEFIAHGLSNENFRNSLTKVTIKPNDPIFKKESWAGIRSGHFQTTLLNLFNRITDLLFSKFQKGIQGPNVAIALEQLATQLAEIDSETKTEIYKGIKKIDGHYAKFLDYLTKLLKAKLNSTPVINTVNKLKNQFNRTKEDPTIGKPIKEAINWYDRLGYGKLKALITEGTGETPRVAWLHQLVNARNISLDAAKETFVSHIRKIADGFFEDLPESTRIALTKVGLRTDLTSLLVQGRTVPQLRNILADQGVRTAQIDKLIQELRANPAYTKEMITYYTRAADALGYYRVHSVVRDGDDVQQNALLIASLKNNKGYENTLTKEQIEAATEIVDQLITLKALNYTNQDQNQALAELIDTNPAGMNGYLRLHQELKDLSLEKAFDNNPYQFQKGYIKQIFNPKIQYQVGVLSDEEKFKRHGMYRSPKPLGRDKADPTTGTDFYVYVGRHGKKNSLMSMTTSYSNNRSQGASSADLAYQMSLSTTEGRANNAEILKKKAAIRARMFTDPTIPTAKANDNGMVAQVNDKGEIIQYSYTMNEATKDAYMDQTNDYAKVMAAMAGQIVDKEVSPKINKDLVEGLKIMYDNEYNDRPDRYVEISPYTNNTEMRELYYRLPDKMRQNIQAVWGSKRMYVADDVVLLAFGFRQQTVLDRFTKTKEERTRRDQMVVDLFRWIAKGDKDKAFATADTVEDIMFDLTKLAKDNIIVRTLSVTLSNFGSNLWYLRARRVALSFTVHYGSIAIKKGMLYEAQHHELGELKVQLAILKQDPNSDPRKIKKMADRIVRLESDITRNPVTQFIEAGGLPQVIEDLDQDIIEGDYPGLLERTTDKVVSKLPKLVQNVGKVMFMTQDTAGYKMLNNGVKLTDYVGRYILYQHYMKVEGMTHEEAMPRVISEFVNFALPTHPTIEYYNRLGFLWFTKFGIRIIKPIAKTVMDKPLDAVLSLVGSNHLGMDNILNSTPGVSNWSYKLGNPISSSVGSIDEIWMIRMLKSIFG